MKLKARVPQQTKKAARSASPCSQDRPELPRKISIQKPPPPSAPSAAMGYGASKRKAPPAKRSRSRSSSRQSSSSSAVEIVSTSKRARLVSAEQAEVASSSAGKPVLNTNSGAFQDAVLERLRGLCGGHEDAKVLAEFIVAMVAGNKSRKDMASELEAFFPDQGQTTKFVEWVEECKWKFLTSGSLAAPATAAAKGPSPRARMSPKPALQSAPRMDASPLARKAPIPRVTSPLQSSPLAKVSSSKLAPNTPVREGKKELLENMTRQLQLILSKLNNRDLNDETREKYQALAQSIQTQMSKITRAQAPQRRR